MLKGKAPLEAHEAEVVIWGVGDAANEKRVIAECLHVTVTEWLRIVYSAPHLIPVNVYTA